jgi:S-(hydroxymethyl)glutathione dehydrogenase/alcohol dehydrogenase
MEFKAAVLHEVGGPLAIEQVEAGPLKATDVLVRLKASGLCHTDLEAINGQLVYPLPLVLGHEAAGIVEAVGDAVRLVKPGDHVVCSWNPNCGYCFYCDRDQPILCEPFTAHQPQGRLLDGESRLRLNGARLHHFMMVSGFAEYCVVLESGAIPIPDDIPLDRACLIGCGVMTGVGAVLRVAKASVGESAVVIGCGGVGLNAVQGARLARADPVIAVDVSPEKLTTAKAFGATHTIDARNQDTAKAVRVLTRGRGADNVFEAAGNEASFRLAFEAARSGGRVVILGKTNVDREICFRWGALMGEKRMVRSSYGGARPREDFPLLARLYRDGELMLDELISERISLDQINEGFAAMANGEIIRAVIEFPD